MKESQVFRPIFRDLPTWALPVEDSRREETQARDPMHVGLAHGRGTSCWAGDQKLTRLANFAVTGTIEGCDIIASGSYYATGLWG